MAEELAEDSLVVPLLNELNLPSRKTTYDPRQEWKSIQQFFLMRILMKSKEIETSEPRQRSQSSTD